MRNGSRMNAHRIYGLTVVRFFKGIFSLGPCPVNMFRALRYVNPALGMRGQNKIGLEVQE